MSDGVRDSQPATGGLEPDPHDLITTALEYAAAGWPVFPLTPRGKQPLYGSPHRRDDPLRATCRGECGQMGHGVHDATTSFETIADWWMRTPAANIGIACGAPGPDVLDVDIKNGAPGRAALEDLKRTPLIDGAGLEVRTWSGGTHLYFSGSKDQGNGRLPTRGLDFRSNGGYVVAPPSIVEGKRYVIVASGVLVPSGIRWDGIRDFLVPPRRYQSASQHVGAQSAKGLIKFVEGQKEGNRNSGLHWAACRMAEMDSDELEFIELERTAIGIGLREAEVRATIASARRTARVPG